MSWETLFSTTLVPVASVLSTATVAVWTKRIDARTKREDRDAALVLDYEKRAGEDKKAVLKRLISATLYLKRGAEPLAGTEVTEESTCRRRAEAIRELYEFRARLGLDDGVAELMIYAAEPVRDLTELILDEWDRQFREHGYSLTQLDACKEQLQTAVDVPQNNDEAMIERKRKWTALKDEEASFLKELGDKSDLDVDALVVLCQPFVESRPHGPPRWLRHREVTDGVPGRRESKARRRRTARCLSIAGPHERRRRAGSGAASQGAGRSGAGGMMSYLFSSSAGEKISGELAAVLMLSESTVSRCPR